MTVLFVPVTGGNGVQDIVGMTDCGLIACPPPLLLRAVLCVQLSTYRVALPRCIQVTTPCVSMRDSDSPPCR
jgi:hypothetical protein